jgi:hypothetical protein
MHMATTPAATVRAASSFTGFGNLKKLAIRLSTLRLSTLRLSTLRLSTPRLSTP